MNVVIMMVLMLVAASPALAIQASFDCSSPVNETEVLICKDEELARLDRQMADVFKSASVKSGAGANRLRAEQRAWIASRDASGTAKDARAAVKASYETRIAELQVRYELVEERGPFDFLCDYTPPSTVRMTFYESVRPGARAARGDERVTLFAAPSASGAKYEGAGVTVWEHQGEASITWGPGAKEMRCTKQ